MLNSHRATIFRGSCICLGFGVSSFLMRREGNSDQGFVLCKFTKLNEPMLMFTWPLTTLEKSWNFRICINLKKKIPKLVKITKVSKNAKLMQKTLVS